MAKEHIKLKDNKEREAKEKAKQIVKGKDLSKLSQTEVRDLVVELSKMHGLI